MREAFGVIADRSMGIGVLVNNAAVFEHSALADATDEHILATVGIDLVGAMLCTRAAISLMRLGGYIIDISSGAAAQTFPALSVYSAAKARLEHFSLCLHEELAPSWIKVTIVRTGQMIERGTGWDDKPDIAAAADRAAASGLDPRARPTATFQSVADAVAQFMGYAPDLSRRSSTSGHTAIADMSPKHPAKSMSIINSLSASAP